MIDVTAYLTNMDEGGLRGQVIEMEVDEMEE